MAQLRLAPFCKFFPTATFEPPETGGYAVVTVEFNENKLNDVSTATPELPKMPLPIPSKVKLVAVSPGVGPIRFCREAR